MKKLILNKFAEEPSMATTSFIKLNEDLQIGDSGTSFSELSSMNFFFKLFNFETKEFGGAKWLKVYYTNSNNGTVLWKDVDELGCTFQKYKWSILGMLPNFYNSSYGGYEFLLEYPSLGKYNRWCQTSDPLLANQSVKGYSAINVSMTENNWGGLALSSTKGTSTIIDGSPKDTNTWYYAIGQQTAYQGGIPANSPAVQEVYLWIRIG